MEEQLIADLIEARQSRRKVMKKVNIVRKLDNPNKKHINTSAIDIVIKDLRSDSSTIDRDTFTGQHGP